MAEYLMDYIYGELDNRTANAVCWKRYHDLPTPSSLQYMRYAILENSGTDIVYQCRKIDGEYVWVKQTQEDLLKAINELNKAIVATNATISNLKGEVDEIKKQGKGDKGDQGEKGDPGTPGQPGRPTDLLVNGTSVVDADGIARLTTSDFVEAGQNITIDGKIISAKDTTYSAGENISINADNVISAVDTTYSAGDNIIISDQNVISVKPEALKEETIPEDWKVEYNIGGYFKDEVIKAGTSLKKILNTLLTLPKEVLDNCFYCWTVAGLDPDFGPTSIEGTSYHLHDEDWRRGSFRFTLSPNKEFECFAYPQKVKIGDQEFNLPKPTRIWDNDDSDHDMINYYRFKEGTKDGEAYWIGWYCEELKATNDVTTVFWR